MSQPLVLLPVLLVHGIQRVMGEPSRVVTLTTKPESNAKDQVENTDRTGGDQPFPPIHQLLFTLSFFRSLFRMLFCSFVCSNDL